MIRPSVLTQTLLAAVLAASGFAAFAQEKVTVQLKWLPQAQFAGYYVAQEAVGSVLVEHHAAVGAAGDLERDAGRQVRLDESGDEIGRASCRERVLVQV